MNVSELSPGHIESLQGGAEGLRDFVNRVIRAHMASVASQALELPPIQGT